ncbi:MAG TPA: DNA topoisomerase IB, partial [Sphingopyxis sp.]|nr:DNA topoisomerase IB [Sphingopyxis sp.]
MSGRLCFSDDSTPGITRRRKGRYWQYFDAAGKRITDRDEIDRLNGIGLPPAYV